MTTKFRGNIREAKSW